MAQVYIGLGSNLDNPAQQIHHALKTIKYHPDMKLLKVSSFYTSKPWGGVEQDDFINAVCLLETQLSPQELLTSLHHIEAIHNRTREVRWGARTLDLDILYYDQLNLQTEELTIPHVELKNRAFTVIPLLEIIDPNFYQYFELKNLAHTFPSDLITEMPFIKPDFTGFKRVNQNDKFGIKLYAAVIVTSIIIILLFVATLYMLLDK